MARREKTSSRINKISRLDGAPNILQTNNGGSFHRAINADRLHPAAELNLHAIYTEFVTVRGEVQPEIRGCGADRIALRIVCGKAYANGCITGACKA